MPDLVSLSVRLDNYLMEKYPGYSRSLIQKLIKNGHVKVAETIVTKNGFKIKPGTKVDVDMTVLELPNPDLEIKVIYEDDDLVVVNKPEGILSHSKGQYNPEATVASWLTSRDKYDFPLDNDRGGIVHRLDRLTSGIMICAKNKPTYTLLQKQFQSRNTKKTYIAWVSGQVSPPAAVIDRPIVRNPKSPKTFMVHISGKESRTSYEVIDSTDKYSLLELKPFTGRTHQLRVHLTSLNHPILGDVLYGGKPYVRMMLHAKSLEITIPGGKCVIYEAPIPAEFSKVK